MEYDVVILGAGPVAQNVADRVVQGGLTAVLAERDLVGGDCSYWACMPSKALIRSGAALRAAEAVGGAAETVDGELDVSAVLARRNRFTNDWDDTGEVGWLESAGIALERGTGRITGQREVSVTAADGSVRYLTARHAVVISTGSDPVLPDIPGLLASRPWTPREATSARHAPKSLAIIGGGAVASELATAYASFGTRVTVLARSGLLSSAEDFAGELVAEGLRELGVTVLKAAPERVERSEDGFAITADGEVVVAEKLLVATGRAPRTADIGLEAVGLEPGQWLSTDDTLLVPGFDWLYATGDVNHRALLTHQGKYQGRAAGDVIVARANDSAVDDRPWGFHVATADHAAVPQVVFSAPEVASVGLTSRAAEEAGREIRVIDYDLGSVAGARLHADGYRGKARLVVDEQRGTVIGATLVGPDVAELIHAATIAIVGEVPLERLWHAVPAYPTMSELWLRLLEGYGRPSAAG